MVTLSYDDDDDVQGLLGLVTFSYYYMVTLSYDDYDVQGLDTISGFQLYGDMLSPKDQTKNSDACLPGMGQHHPPPTLASHQDHQPIQLLQPTRFR